MEEVCASCGAANPTSVQFCMFCGSFLEWSDDTRTDPGPVLATPAPSAPRTSVLPTVAADEEPVVLASVRPLGSAAPSGQASSGHGWSGAALADPPAELRAPDAGCPVCHRPNTADRHFCSHCGATLRREPAGPAVSSTSGWRRMLQDRDRVARREYRRSLPPLYRWRRAVLVVLVPLLAVGGLAATGRHPVRWVQEHWWTLRGSTVAVTGVTASTSPSNASRAGSDPASLVDGTEQAWTEPWAPVRDDGTSCGGAEGTGVAVLRFPSTRIQKLVVTAGQPASNPARPLELRPRSIGVRFDSGECHRFSLADVADPQTITIDSGTPVSSVMIGVDTVFPTRPDGKRVLSLTEVSLWSWPS